jgi:hypothetical protein
LFQYLAPANWTELYNFSSKKNSRTYIFIVVYFVRKIIRITLLRVRKLTSTMTNSFKWFLTRNPRIHRGREVALQMGGNCREDKWDWMGNGNTRF